MLSLDLSKSAKKVWAKVRSATSGAGLLLHNFAGCEWEEMKESSFTTALTKLFEAKLEAAHEQVEPLIKDADKWHAGISCLKIFTKKHREAVRSRAGQSEKLGKMGELADTAYDFLKESILPGVTFNMIRLKCKFFQDVGDADKPRSITDRLQVMANLGLAMALESLDASGVGQSKADCWMRSLLVGHLVTTIRT